MAGAIVLIDTKPGNVTKVLKELKDFDFVEETQMVTGDHDLMVLIRMHSTQDIMQAVVDKIRKIYGVRDTTTLNFVEPIKSSGVP